LIRAHWPETDESRLKDYIEKPKPNGYQSLHHTSKIISRGFESPFEVQVRSEDMHHLAEFGLAAHWDYKLSSRSSGAQEKATATGGLLAPTMILPTQEPVFPSREVEIMATDHVFTSNNGYGSALVLSPSPIDDDTDAPSASGHVASGPYVTALIHAKEMLTNQVYVFVMDKQREDHGELISVPVGSRVVDAMAKSVNASSVATAKVWRNDLPAQLNETVLNGDVLMISL
jgi:Region found in RelA / SpoT proteins